MGRRLPFIHAQGLVLFGYGLTGPIEIDRLAVRCVLLQTIGQGHTLGIGKVLA
jgi:hypothetical protein